MIEKKYRLASGTQVRQENFGLLFYTMKGPRLYFLPTGSHIGPSLFSGEISLQQAMAQKNRFDCDSNQGILKIAKSLEKLIDKGVILEC